MYLVMMILTYCVLLGIKENRIDSELPLRTLPFLWLLQRLINYFSKVV